VASDDDQRQATGSRAERSEACARKKESGGGARAVPTRKERPHAHVGRRSPAATDTSTTTARWARSPVVTCQTMCVGRTG
jgi:hypothetical protein